MNTQFAAAEWQIDPPPTALSHLRFRNGGKGIVVRLELWGAKAPLLPLYKSRHTTTGKKVRDRDIRYSARKKGGKEEAGSRAAKVTRSGNEIFIFFRGKGGKWRRKGGKKPPPHPPSSSLHTREEESWKTHLKTPPQINNCPPPISLVFPGSRFQKLFGFPFADFFLLSLRCQGREMRGGGGGFKTLLDLIEPVSLWS